MSTQWRVTRHTRKLLTAAALSLTLLPGVSAALTQVGNFGSNPGNIAMYKYVPSGLSAGAPLVVALHGCTQTAQAYVGAGWNELADEHGFAVLYPEQNSSNNQNACWNFFEPAHQNRGQGEPLSIKQMVDKMIADHGVDTDRIYVTGLSAGGAMTNVMLATYPDVFSGGAPIAGIPYKCASDMNAAFSCMSPGVTKSPQEWGNLVRGATNHSGPWPKVSIWHGDADYTVVVANAEEQMKQWTNVNGTNQSADSSNTVDGYPHTVYGDVVETYIITGMGHGTPVDPANGCGTAGAYILDEGICSSYYAAEFFGIAEGGGTGGDDGGNGDDGNGDDGLYCGSAGNLDHYHAGRATRSGSGDWDSYYAAGSWQWMGYHYDSTTLEETSPGHFVIVQSCP